jgi:Fe-S-cluster containining protein
MQPFYEKQPLHFSCTQCGKCCLTTGDYYVYLTEAESEAIRNRLQLTRSWFRRRYLERLEDGEWVLVSGKGDRCIFLDANRQCRVYSVRPLQCSTYPFWPELTGSARDWNNEARRCEGINRGKAVPLANIRRSVKACLEQDG